MIVPVFEAENSGKGMRNNLLNNLRNELPCSHPPEHDARKEWNIHMTMQIMLVSLTPPFSSSSSRS